MDGFQEQCQPGEIKACPAGRIDTEILPRDLSTEGGFLQIDEAIRAFEVCHSGGIAAFEAFEFPPAGDLEFQGVHELRAVPLQESGKRFTTSPLRSLITSPRGTRLKNTPPMPTKGSA
ncbi:hypothetical protein ACDY97_09250 [Rhizobium mongolense]|uniref:hypothetical protein n=1 Tax=Rhizobium mongolense TaxID=57676 RepID=UPI003557A2D6